MPATNTALDQQRLERLIEVGRGLVSNLDLESLLSQILEVARELTGARYAALGILNRERTELERFLTVGIDAETRERIGDLPRGRGVLGLLIEHPEPLRLSNVADHQASYGFPPAHPPMSTFLGVPITIRNKAFGNLYLTEKESGEFDDQDEAACVVLADWAAIAIDNARLYQSVQARKNELEQAVTGLEATTTIARALGGETDLDRVLELIAKRGRALVKASWLAILLSSGNRLEIVAVAGKSVDELDGGQIPIKGSVAGQVLESRRPQRIAQVSSNAPASLELASSARTALFVPLVFQGYASGVLVAADKRHHEQPFSAEDERLMESFAASAATAVHTAKSVAAERLRRSIEASEQERRRWARELHDETLQGLGALQVSLSTALRRDDPDMSRRAISDAVEDTKLQITNLRHLIAELRPAALDELGLEAALDGLVRRAIENAGLEVDARIDLPEAEVEQLSPELESTVYRLMQEALTNVDKHAKASGASIEVVISADSIRMLVADDGIGFDTSNQSGGFGLSGMRERVMLAGGRLEIASPPGEGTRIEAVIPLAPAE